MKLGILWVGGQNFSEAKFCISAPAPRGTTQGRSQDFRSGGGHPEKVTGSREMATASSERTSVFDRRTISVLRSTYS